jgi:membrane protein required for colicin V production
VSNNFLDKEIKKLCGTKKLPLHTRKRDHSDMPIDIGFALFFIYGFFQGYRNGIISTVLNLLLYIFGFVLAFKISPTTTNVMKGMFHSDNPVIFLAAFFVNLLIIIAILRYTAKGLEGLLRMAYLGIINRVAGGVAMGGFMVLVFSVLVWFGVKVQFFNEDTLQDSRTYSFLEPIPGKAKDFAIRMKPFALDVWGTSLDWMDRLDEYGIKRTDDQGKTYRPPDNPKSIEHDPSPSSAPPPKRRPSRPVWEDEDGIEE